MKLNILFSLFFCFCFFTIISCQGSNKIESTDTEQDGSKIISISATIGDSFNVAGRSGSRADSKKIDQVWAVPVNFNNLIENMTNRKIIVPIKADGKLDIQIPNDQNDDWMLLLVDSTNTKDPIVSYISVKDDLSNMLKLPLSYSDTSSIELGTLTADSDEAVSANNLTTLKDSFTLTIESLKQIAKTDKLLKLIKNFYNNYSEADKNFKLLSPQYHFVENDLNQIIVEEGLAIKHFHSYNIFFETSKFTDIPSDCTTIPSNAVVISIPPLSPAISVWGSGEYRLLTEFTTDSLINNETLFCNTATICEIPVANVYTSSILGDVPQGIWTISNYNKTTTIATFDFAFGSVLYGKELDKPAIFIPKIKLITGDDKTVTKIQIRWVIFNKSGVESPADMNVFLSTINKGSMPYIEIRNKNDKSLLKDSPTFLIAVSGNLTEIDLTSPGLLTAPAKFSTEMDKVSIGDDVLNDVRVYYNSYGSNFQFQYYQRGTVY